MDPILRREADALPAALQGIVNVDFEFFDPNANDYHATKNLLIQLFQSDAQTIGVETLAELLIGQTLVGTTVKTDGKDSDPYAFLSILNLHIHKVRLPPCEQLRACDGRAQENASIKALRDYILAKAPSVAPLLQQTDKHVGFVFSERLINMPVQVMPPMYRMLVDEMQWAIDDGEPYVFSHYIFISRTYTPSAEQEMDWAGEAPPTSKRQKQAPRHEEEGRTHSFHFEDEVIAKVRWCLFHLLDPFPPLDPCPGAPTLARICAQWVSAYGRFSRARMDVPDTAT